jgi:hypothetical protein
MNPTRSRHFRCCKGRWEWTLLLLVLAAAPASAQVIQIQGGSSSLFQANGGSLELYSAGSTGRFDLGVLDRPEVGFSFTKRYKGWDWSAGDQIIPFVLPTDLFSRSYYFMGRGLSLQTNGVNDRLLFYAGTTSVGYRTPYLNVARSQLGVELVFYEHQISPTKRFYSYNILSSRQTSLQGFEWTPRQGLKVATTAGIGADQGYWSGSLDYQRGWIHVQSNYTRSGNSFRRVDVQAPLVAETSGANIRVELQPTPWLALTVGHQNYLNPALDSSAGVSAGVDSLGASVEAGGFRFNGSAFHSRTRLNNLHSFTVGAERSLGGRTNVGVSYFQSRAGNATWKSVSTLLRERLSRRFSLSQVITESEGHTTLALGGNYVSNRFSIGLEHQTFFFPFADGAHSAFRQALMINVQLRLPHNIELHGATAVDALGRLRYTSYVDSYLYPGGSGPNGNGGYRRLPVYVVRGIVVDEHARPVRGAALEIDGQSVFTDSQGFFLLRVKKRKPYPLEVLTDQFMFPGQYEVVSAPASVQAGLDETAKSYEIVLKRVFPRQPALSAAGSQPANQASR